MSKYLAEDGNKINPNRVLTKWLCCGSGTKKSDKKSKKLPFDYGFDKKHPVTRNYETAGSNYCEEKPWNANQAGNEEKQAAQPTLGNNKLEEALNPRGKDIGRLSYREKSGEYSFRKELEHGSTSEHYSVFATLPELKCKSKSEYFKLAYGCTEEAEKGGEFNEESYQVYPIKTSVNISEVVSIQMKKNKPQEVNESFDIKYRLTESRNDRKVANEELLKAIKEDDLAKYMPLLQIKEKEKRNYDLNYLSDEGFGALHYACLNGNQMLCNILLHYGAPIDHPTINKQTPLMLCAQKGFSKIAYLLLVAGARLNQKDIFHNTALHYAVESGKEKAKAAKFNLSVFIDSKEIVDLFLGVDTLDISILNHNLMSATDLAKSRELKDKLSTHSKRQMQMSSNSQIISLPLSSSQPHLIKSITVEDKTLDSTNNEKIDLDRFNVLKMIGKGSFGEVYLIEKKTTKKVYAMKVLSKQKVQQQNLLRYVQTERNILQQSIHPFIVKLKSAFQNANSLFLVMAYYPGGDLGKYLAREKRFSEDKTRLYLTEIILALDHLHKNNIVFRDLKPENVLVDAQGHLALTDFGLSKQGITDWVKGTNSFCGSVAYLSPEVVNKTGHGKAVDWYLLGVMMYEMLVGIPPYYSKNRQQMIDDIKRGPLKFPKSISDNAKSLMIGLLQRNPAKRLGSGGADAQEIKQHVFFQGVDWEKVKQREQIMPDVVFPRLVDDKESIEKFNKSKGETMDINLDVEGWTYEAIDFFEE